MGFLSRLFGAKPKPTARLGETLRLEMAVEAMMVTWLYRFLTESGISKPAEAVKIAEDMARADVFQVIQKNSVEQAATKAGVPATILEKYHLVEALVGFYDGHGNSAAVHLVRSREYPALEEMIKSDMTITGKNSMADYMHALESGSAEAYSLGNAALLEWVRINVLDARH